MSETTQDVFRVGSVLRRSFALFFSQFPLFGGIAVASQIPIVFYSLFATGLSAAPQADRDNPLKGILPKVFLGSSASGDLEFASTLLLWLVTAALTYAAIAHLNGRKPGYQDCFEVGLVRLLPTLGVIVCLVALVGLPFGIIGALSEVGEKAVIATAAAVAVVGAAYFLVVFALVVPAAVIERPGVFGAFRRSRELTLGWRWRVLGIYIIVITLEYVALFAVQSATGSLQSAGVSKASILIELVLISLSQTFSIVVGAVMYQDLRTFKEGADSDEVAAVFD